MLKNMKIGPRLGFGFGIIMTLLVIMGGVSIYEINVMDDEIDLMVNDRFPKTIQANNVIDNMNIIARALRNIVIDSNKDNVEAELKRIADSRKLITDTIETLTQTITSQEGKAILAKISAIRPVYVKQTEQYMELVRTGNIDQADRKSVV